MVVESRSRFSISGYKALAVGSNLEVASCVEQGELWVLEHRVDSSERRMAQLMVACTPAPIVTK